MNHSTALFDRMVAQRVKVSAVLRPSHPAAMNAKYQTGLSCKKRLQAKPHEFYAFNTGAGE